MSVMLSKNLSLSEVTYSPTAVRRGLNNTPTDIHLTNLKYVAKTIFQPLREHFGVPIYISSGYRSRTLNRVIGGSNRSFHTRGMALDLDQDGRGKGVSNADVFYYIKNNLPYTELIWEFGDNNNPNWVHVAIARGREHEKQTKTAFKEKGRTKYKQYN